MNLKQPDASFYILLEYPSRASLGRAVEGEGEEEEGQKYDPQEVYNLFLVTYGHPPSLSGLSGLSPPPFSLASSTVPHMDSGTSC